MRKQVKLQRKQWLLLREVALEKSLLSAQLDEILGPLAMTSPGVHGKERVGLF